MAEVAESGSKMRVLVIDDDDIARELLCSTLQAAGHETFELQSSIGATRCIHEQKVHAVVLDVMLPTVNGDKLARMLRQSNGGEQLGIVLVSSRPKPELRQLATLAQADDVVTKSEVHRGLVLAVQRAVVRRAGPRRRNG
ncbi:MAG TPA: response regulator [Polyangiaceae bacterium]|nr:response regulator [Polyangiaceae bacterium]